MSFKEKTIDRTVIYNGHIIDLEVHKVELPDGQTSTRELVYHNGAVAICAVTPNNEVLLVKQYRKAVEQTLLEIPAGKLEQQEEREEAAKRELEEETGYKTNTLQHITDMYGSPGFCNEKLSIYFTDKLIEGTLNLDDDEFVELYKIPIDNIRNMLDNKEIEDAKTVIALQYLLLNYNHSK
ncbi:NUDIX domain-containing protein [Staphylococcus simiae]|uniref:MutT/nudix family protein n=1 Tax=Staphylococcus simiae CCM 7213 = CCUG 51256 TaxID=911238 RepID=G5JFD9_9STAP|nr:NUDIX hydrolase [Staphylococcus simiae]EHJ09110.1 MutT/nudix family protein [Staphylococcus simiae CCM 7213 = CCUG 51256]PNZ14199.1 NUDIX hydrolase [Staphylococcus simiae]SNV72350.1 ADP-ribose pyrophosphatase [Staphylococcus simiae]